MSDLKRLQADFEAELPIMRDVIRGHFSKLNVEAREEAVQNTLGLIWKAWLRLGERGKAEDPGILRSVTCYAVKQTRCGRTPQGKSKRICKDPFDYRIVGRVQFEEVGLDQFIKTTTPIPDQVSFRIDVPAFFATLNPYQRQLAEDLMNGMSASKVAKKHKVTPGAISQFRARFKRLFDDFFAK